MIAPPAAPKPAPIVPEPKRAPVVTAPKPVAPKPPHGYAGDHLAADVGGAK